MIGRPSPEQRLRRLLLGFWLVPAIVGTVGFVLVPSRLNPDLSLVGIVTMQLAMWGGWSLWTWLLWLVGDALAVRRVGMAVQLVVFAGCGAVVVATQIMWQAAVATRAGIAEARGFESTLVIGLRTNGDYFVVMFAALVLAQSAIRWLASLQAERVAAAQLGADLARAQLSALRAQMQPHFLFNALNSIVALIARDQALAQQVTVQLSDLLRLSLRTGESQEVPLSQELELTRRYLALEQVRFADRLAVEWQLAEGDDPLIPALALQPLVENALVHGIARCTNGGRITIATHLDAQEVTLRVHNSGPGLWPPSSAKGNGLALANLRERLERLYGDAAELRLHDDSGDGVTATVRVPRRERGDIANRKSAVGAETGAASPAANDSHGLLPT